MFVYVLCLQTEDEKAANTIPCARGVLTVTGECETMLMVLQMHQCDPLQQKIPAHSKLVLSVERAKLLIID